MAPKRWAPPAPSPSSGFDPGRASLPPLLPARVPLPTSPALQDAIRGATYDLLSGRPREHFDHEPPHAFATLSEDDRRVLRAKLLGRC